MLRHLDGVACRDILSGEDLPMKARRVQLQIPPGTLRVMDIEHRQPWKPQYHRRGLLKVDDSPYPILVDYTRRTNEEVYELVYQRGK